MEQSTKNTGIAGVVIAGIVGVAIAAMQYQPWNPKPRDSDLSGVAAPVGGSLRPADEVAKDIVRKAQVLEFLTIYAKPEDFDDAQLSEVLSTYYVPAKQGGRAAQQVAEMVHKLRASGRHYSKSESRLVSMDFDPIAISGADMISVKTHEMWYLPYYQGKQLLPRNPEVPSSVTYNLRKLDGKWKIESTTNPYIHTR